MTKLVFTPKSDKHALKSTRQKNGLKHQRKLQLQSIAKPIELNGLPIAKLIMPYELEILKNCHAKYVEKKRFTRITWIIPNR